MKRNILIFPLMLLLVFCMAGCGQERQTQETENTEQEQTEYIGPVPEEYFTASRHGGQVIEVTYDSRDYTEASQPAIQKTAYVYLPYGYDETDQDTRYDILYLMHTAGP